MPNQVASNQVYDGIMYNQERKKAWLSKFPDRTQQIYSRVFYSSRTAEEMLEKDLVDFTLDELTDFFESMRPLTISAAKMNFSVANNYLIWAIDQGYREVMMGSNVNFLDSVRPNLNNYLRRIVPDNIELYITKDELDDIIGICYNVQDKVLFSLLFNGVDIQELCNLKKTDVTEDGWTTLTNAKGETRDYKIEDEECLQLIREASNEMYYYANNGEGSESIRGDKMELINNEYVIRSAKTRNKDEGAVKPHVIYRRLKEIAKMIDNPYLTSKNIYRSGQIYEAYDLYKRDGKIEKEQIVEICDKYGLKKVKQGNYFNYNITNMKEYLNVENVKRLYKV